MFLLKLCFVFICLTSINAQPCKVHDQACITKSANAAYTKIIAGIPSAGIDVLDPMHHEVIEGDLSILKFKLTNSTVRGLKDCFINNVKMDMNKMKMHVDMTCPWIQLSGKYVINGRLIVLDVQGDGDYSMKSGRYRIWLDCDIKTVKGKDSKDHLNIKNFNPKYLAEEKVEFDFKNLFNGQKILADAVLKFANGNWKEVADFLQGPVLNAHFKKIVSNTNKYMKTIPFENMITY